MDVRSGEAGLVAILTLAAFSIISAHYFLKPASKSFFLAAHGSQSLPDAYLAVAVVTAFVGTGYGRLSRRLSLAPLLNIVLGLLAVLVVAFWFWLRAGTSGISSQAFYVFASTYGVLGPAMLWFAINQALEPRQARRLIGFVGAGAIGGGIVAGYAVHFLLKTIDTVSLLWGAAGWILVALACLNYAVAKGAAAARRAPRKQVGDSTMKLVISHRYLRLLTGLIAIVMVVATMSEYLFLWAVEQHVAPGAPTADFVATWYSHLNLVCLPLQLLVTAPLLRRFGVGPALLILPMTLTLVAAGMAIWPILAFGVSMKVGESALRYSVNKSAVELLYLPLPGWIKDRTKVFVDTVVDRLAKGGAGVLLKILIVAGSSIHVIAGVTAGLCATWALGSIVIRRRYVEAFRDALDRGSVDLKTERIRLDETGALTAVGLRLDGSPNVVRQALDVLVDGEGARLRKLLPQLSNLAGSPDPAIASRALRLLARDPSPQGVAAASARLDDPSPLVAASAAEVLLAASPNPDTILRERSRHGLAAEAQAAAALFARGLDVPDKLVERLLSDYTPSGHVARLELAEALSEGKLPHRRELLRRLMADPDSDVAVAAIRGAGSLRDASIIPFLVAELRRPLHRASARAALATMGAATIGPLETWFWDPRIEMPVRQRLPRAIEEVGGTEAADALMRGLSIQEPHLRHQVLKSLNRLTKEGRVRVPDAPQRAQLLSECRYLCELLAISAASPLAGGPCRKLYGLALAQSVRAARQRLFRVLGLRSQGRHWANAFAGLVSGDARLRASAIEFVDGTLPDKLRRVVVPVIDDIDTEDAVRRAGPALGVRPLSAEEALVAAAKGPDGWLAACALHAASEERIAAALPVAASRLDDGNIWVRDAAAAAERALALPATG
jgi:ATP:ADP antiporter, AAA family